VGLETMIIPATTFVFSPHDPSAEPMVWQGEDRPPFPRIEFTLRTNPPAGVSTPLRLTKGDVSVG